MGLRRGTTRAEERRAERAARSELLRELWSSVYSRDRGACLRCCETQGKLDAHHRLPRSRGGKDELENLILLCHRCHMAVHEHRVEDWGDWID